MSCAVNTDGAQDAPHMTPRARINPCGETVLEFLVNPDADLHRHCASPCSQRPQRSHVFISGLSPALWPSLSETRHGGKGSEGHITLTVQTVLPGFLLTTLQAWLVCPSGEPAAVQCTDTLLHCTLGCSFSQPWCGSSHRACQI